MADKKRKTCAICGMGFVPTSNGQKYCPDCRKRRQAAQKEKYSRKKA